MHTSSAYYVAQQSRYCFAVLFRIKSVTGGAAASSSSVRLPSASLGLKGAVRLLEDVVDRFMGPMTGGINDTSSEQLILLHSRAESTTISRASSMFSYSVT